MHLNRLWLFCGIAAFALFVLYRIFWGVPAIHNFQDAKYVMENYVVHDQRRTVYCAAEFDEDKRISANYTPTAHVSRATRMEWEHAVPVSDFGATFPEWHKKNKLCRKHGKYIGGRKCAEQNPEFVKIETDLYNLFPSIGSVNATRANRKYAALPAIAPAANICGARLASGQFEPPDRAKGQVARASLYMAGRYPDRVRFSDGQLHLFRAWSNAFPVTAAECQRARRIERIQKNENLIVKRPCQAAGLW